MNLDVKQIFKAPTYEHSLQLMSSTHIFLLGRYIQGQNEWILPLAMSLKFG